MIQEEKHKEVSRSIDHYLLDGNFDALALTPDHKYQTWYATLLSSLALLVGGETVEFAYASYAPTQRDAQISVFTTNLVLVADVDTTADAVPVVQAVSRHSLMSMSLSAATRIDAQHPRSYDWPGTLNLRLHYRDLSKSIEIVASGTNPSSLRESPAIVLLIEGLSVDLSANRQ